MYFFWNVMIVQVVMGLTREETSPWIQWPRRSCGVLHFLASHHWKTDHCYNFSWYHSQTLGYEHKGFVKMLLHTKTYQAISQLMKMQNLQILVPCAVESLMRTIFMESKLFSDSWGHNFEDIWLKNG